MSKFRKWMIFGSALNTQAEILNANCFYFHKFFIVFVSSVFILQLLFCICMFVSLSISIYSGRLWATFGFFWLLTFVKWLLFMYNFFLLSLLILFVSNVISLKNVDGPKMQRYRAVFNIFSIHKKKKDFVKKIKGSKKKNFNGF